VILNNMSRYHLAAEALKRSSRIRPQASGLLSELQSQISKNIAYSREHLEDMPEIRTWIWS